MLLSLYIKITSNLKHRAEKKKKKKKKTQKTQEEETIFFRNEKYKIRTYINPLFHQSNVHADNA